MGWADAPIVAKGGWQSAPLVGAPPATSAAGAATQATLPEKLDFLNAVGDQAAGQTGVPEGGYRNTSGDIVSAIMAPVPSHPEAAVREPTWADSAANAVYGAQHRVNMFAQGGRKGIAGLAGLPADLVNMAPMLGNLPPGEQGFEPFMDQPPLGGNWMYENVVSAPRDMLSLALTGQPAQETFARNAGDRFAESIGEQVGATLPFVGGAGAVASNLGREGVKELSPLARHFVEPMTVAPGKTTARELTYAGAAGTGAQMANEAAGGDREGTFWTNLLGALGGVGTLAAGAGTVDAARSLVSTLSRNPAKMGDLVGEEVAKRLAANSSLIGEQVGPAIEKGITPVPDYSPLAAALRQRAPVEDAVPGYTADIGTRSGDPLLKTFAEDVNRANPGYANLRRTENNAAVDSAITGVAPKDNPAKFGANVAAGAQGRIDEALRAAEAAQRDFDAAAASVKPTMTPGARGSLIRNDLMARRDAELQKVSDLFAQIDQTGVPVDLTELRSRFDALTGRLNEESLNDARRFLPAEVGTAQQLSPPAGQKVDTGIVDQYGTPITRPTLPTMGPASQATSLRSGLSDTMRGASPQESRVNAMFKDELDRYLREMLPEGQQGTLDQAVKLRADVGSRFEEPNAIGRTLAETGRGGTRIADEAVPGMFVGNDGKGASDYTRLMAETGQEPGTRAAIADQIVADAERAGALRNPDALQKFMSDRGIMLKDFPEVQTALQKAGVAQDAAGTMAAYRDKTLDRYDPATGSGPVAKFRKFDDTQVRSAMATAWKSAKPADAVRELVSVAGDTPDVRRAARAALWEEVAATGKESATDMAGQTRWNARRVRELLDDKRFSAVADELWKDDPEDLASIRTLFSSLEKATEGRTTAAGSSGTAQAMRRGQEPAYTPAMIFSDVRSVQKGNMSPAVAFVGGMTRFLRRATVSAQSALIDRMSAAVVNNPGLAADLLEKFNPADYAASRRMLTQKYGARISSFVNALDQVNEQSVTEDAPAPTWEDELQRAIFGG